MNAMWSASSPQRCGECNGNEKGEKKMTRTIKIVGLIAALVVTFGGLTLSTMPVWAQATQDEFLALRQQEIAPMRLQIAMVDAQIQGSTLGVGSAIEVSEVPFTPECIGLSDALMVDGGARALCR
jgi:hypothetical protein